MRSGIARPSGDPENISVSQLKGGAVSDDVVPLLKVHEYFQGVPEEALQEVARLGRVNHYPAGSVVHEANVVLTTVGFVLRGRLKAIQVDARGVESLFRIIERGEQFGMMIGALAEPVPIRIVALEATTVLNLDFEQAIELTFQFRELRRIWLTTFAGSLRKQFFGTPSRRAPMMLALLHHSPATRGAAQRLVGRLSEVGEKIAVFSDLDGWRGVPEIRYRALHVDGRILELEEIHRQASEWQDANRIMFDVRADLEPDLANRMMNLVERAVYFVPAAETDGAIRRLQALGVSEHGWRDKIAVARLMEEGNPIVPAVPRLDEFACRDFKIAETPFGLPWGRSAASGLERLVHDLRGVRIGVALGGGAARGMSHLGVLKALEQNGIVPDMIAGTSAGAMTGIVYAAGLDPDYSANQFAADLRPPWIFRHLAHGNYWYLMLKYRRGQFDPMLRHYLHDWRLEQLPVPCLSVTVDLVSGNAVVRERADAVLAIRESINLPGFATPICHSGQALIDGGLINNIPADVLVSKGCNFVIAVSVTAKLERKFCDMTPEMPSSPKLTPAFGPTLLRSLLVQNYCRNDAGVRPADVVIEPDVTGFDSTEFMRAKELAAIGETAALEQIPRIRQLLKRLDPQLFG
jgi:predicted acylesterase/phospholipase RssA/CRP-like cAMP-binding protein